MCEPTTMAIMMAAQAAGQVQGQMVQARTQKKIYERTKKAAHNAALMNRVQLNEQLRQKGAAIAKEVDAATREGLKAEATAAVSAGESGVTGRSVDILLNNYSRKRLEFETTKEVERRNMMTNAMFQFDAIDSQAMGRIAAATPTVSSPSLLGAGLSIAGGATQGYAQGQQIQNAGT